MAYHGALIASDCVANDVNSKRRSVKSADDIDNGNVFALAAYTGTSGEREVWTVVKPATGANLTNLYMADGKGIVYTNGKYGNIDPEIGNAYNIGGGEPFTGFKLELGDIVVLTAEALATGSGAGSAYAVAVNNSYQLTWAAAAISGVSLKLQSTGYISIPRLGTLGDLQRVTSYRFEVVALA